MTWFEKLTGFREESPTQLRANLVVEGNLLVSRFNGARFVFGELEIPSLAELRQQVAAVRDADSTLVRQGKPILVREVVADVQRLHADEANAGALFQVASQFNLLEMVSPARTPEEGVGIYEFDATQGPACAIAAGAGTIYRNYFVPVGDQIGQTASKQIDCLADLGLAMGNTDGQLWEMRNGYALASERGLIEIRNRLRKSNEDELNELRGRLRIGLQWNTQVTLEGCKHTVSQAYCSALPVAYSAHPPELWADFAKLILEAAYEATICAAILNRAKAGCNKLFLTLLGGGAFGNDTDWIIAAIERALNLHTNSGLDIVVVSYGSSNPSVRRMVERQ